MYLYFDKIFEILNEVKEHEAGSISKAVELVVKATENKNSIYIFGASHAGILTQEMYYRAGGMITFNPIFASAVSLERTPITSTSKMERLEGYGKVISDNMDFKDGDILFLHSVSGRNPIIIDLALEARKKGVKIIALTNLKYTKSVTSRHTSKKKLFEVSDVVIDNHGDIGDACCIIDNSSGRKAGPSSTVVGATILNEIVVEAAQKLVHSNVEDIPIFYSANLDNGDILNSELVEKYKSQIHYNF